MIPNSVPTYVTRYHDFSYGHRVTDHESKCRHLHGHNGRVTFRCRALGDTLDNVGRVVDFSVIKTKLCQWLEDNWDHRFLIYEKDPMAPSLKMLDDKVVLLPFNPTAENLAKYLLENLGKLLPENITLVSVDFRETEKCGATVELPLPSYFCSASVEQDTRTMPEAIVTNYAS